MSVAGDRARRGVRAVLITLLAIPPGSAAACSVCFSSTSDTRWAYYGTTALMMLVPFLFLAGIALWLRRAARAQKIALGELEVIERGL